MASETNDITSDAGVAAAGTPMVRCAHCDLQVPAGLVDDSADEQFCCHGCRAVYAAIHTCGLESFYRLRDSQEADTAPARTTDRNYAEFDDPVFRKIYCQETSAGTRSVEFYLEGVHCAACVWLVEKLPRVAPGVLEARLNLRKALLRVVWDERQTELSRVARTLDSLGYPPHPARDAQARRLRKQEDRRFLIRIGVAAAAAGNVMMLSFALYGGMFSGMEAQYAATFRWTSMAIGLVSLAWPGRLFFRGAWAALRTRTAHLDLPIALGLLAGGAAGTVNAILGRGELYFDSLTMLVFLLLVGRWLQHRQQRWAGDAVELLYSLTPTSARRVDGDEVCEVPVEALHPGDIIEVRAGDSIPIDGRVVDGTSTVDQSLLTGESCPAEVTTGSEVNAGTVNQAARLRIRVEVTGDETRVGRLMRLVEECSRRRAPVVRLADRVAGWFVVAVVGLAIATLGLWLWLAPARAVDNAVALLIVTCPCALGLATPLAITVAIGRAAKRGILIKGGEVLEQLARRGRVFLDKTGTLTEGKTALLVWHGDQTALPCAVALEAHAAHPIARRAFEQALPDDVTVPRAADVSAAAAGVSGRVDQRRVIVGSPTFVQSAGMVPTGPLRTALSDVLNAALTPVLVAIDGEVVAVAGCGDPVRAEAPAAISDLRHLGWQAGILSGDDPSVVTTVARQVGVPEDEAHGGVTPEAKLDRVRAAAQHGRTMMVGDGVNDAAALSAATVGIAVHGGAEASLAAADVYLSAGGLDPIVEELVRASRRTLAVIRRSLIASCAYNAVAATLAIAGLINPLVAAILMPISSFTVLTLAYVAPTFGDRPCR